jgi:hypothetical protein
VRFRSGLLIAVLVASLLAGCTDDDSATDDTVPPTGGTTTTALTVGEPTDLEDGRTAAFVTAVDVAARTITVDVVQFLRGAEAVTAYREDTGATDTPPNDYWIRNEEDRLRALTVVPTVTIRLVRLGGPDADANGTPGVFEELPEYIQTHAFGDPPPKILAWVSIQDGVVIAIEEQYVP